MDHLYVNLFTDFYLNTIIGGREPAFDDVNRKKKKGFYRESYLDNNDLDKKGQPRLKFKYLHMKDNRPVTNEEQERINKLGLAPAYKDVWVSEDPESKIQATGYDAKGRKQYRYIASHIADSTDDKFVRLYKFIKSMPKLEDQIEKDLKGQLFSKNRTIAVVLRVIQELNLRVGKEIYARTNKSYGACSLKKSHINLTDNDTVVKLNFKAKSNKQASYTLKVPELVAEIKELLNLEGEKIFQYISDSENVLGISDTDLNNYIQIYMGKDFSVKDYRTFGSNFFFIKSLLAETKKRSPKNQKVIKQNLNAAQENTAKQLRHTKSISKKSYTMNLIRDMYVKNPQWFIENKNRQPLNVLIDILKMFKDSLKNKSSDDSSDESNNSNDSSDNSSDESEPESESDSK